ncbi:Phage protein [Streptomyces globisporus]|uniref:Phage protein n=1 Tax=Streptomyces globisporus TaxID=1908 RepID=A0ABM9H780_STRGL|nr:hypothetical protein [Streptomyces globisporus]CAH9419499.1 Phage protein [Streptomyces globisporus]
MARLQILELPEGTGDDRPPFILVIDEVPHDNPVYERFVEDLELTNRLADRVGARAVLVFEDTIDIPANDTSAYAQPPAALHIGDHEVRGVVDEEDEPEDWHGILQTRRRQLTKALGINPLADWHDILRAATNLHTQHAAMRDGIKRVHGLPEQPEIMSAQQPHAEVYLHGYRIAIREAKRAAREPGRAAGLTAYTGDITVDNAATTVDSLDPSRHG